MTRNRKNGEDALRIGVVLKIMMICLFGALCGFGYLWQKNQINQLGHDLKEREVKLERLQKANERLGRVLAQLQSPQEIEARAARMGLDLQPSQPDQVVRLPDRWPSLQNRVYDSDTQETQLARQWR